MIFFKVLLDNQTVVVLPVNTTTGDVAFDRTDPTAITAAGSGVRMMDRHPMIVSVDTYHFWFNKPHTLIIDA